MKINVFSVPDGNVSALKAKFDQVGLKAIHTATDGAWETVFYFSAEQTPAEIPWVSTFAEFFGDLQPENLIYFGVLCLWTARPLLCADLRQSALLRPTLLRS